jgi:hypothetical protein
LIQSNPAETKSVTNARSNLIGLLLVLLAIPVWILVMVEIRLRESPAANQPRSLIAPFVLCGMTAAIHHLLRSRANAWPLSALIAGIGVLALLAWSAG